MKNCYTISRFQFYLALFAMLLFAPRFASAQNGINSDGTDFFVGFMPGIAPTQSSAGVYFLICSYQDNNTVSINYFESSGHEVQGQNLFFRGAQCIEYTIDPNLMYPTRPGEIPEYKAAHIISKYPISVQVYSEGANNGSLYQAIPTAVLGKSYVVAAYNDDPTFPFRVNQDSSSSEFEIIAPYDNTTVTITPNSTTKEGIVGVNSGPQSDGIPHPITIRMQRGQIYWVRSSCTDASQDESGSTIVSNKPIAVLGGQERAMINDPTFDWGGDNEDTRDLCIQEMTPVASWGTDYPSIPTMPASSTEVNQNGDGDMYRVFTNDSKGLRMNYWEDNTAEYGPNFVSLYQLPALQFDNITMPIDMATDPTSVDSSRKLKKFYALQYNYFQGIYPYQTNYRSENEMNLVPIDRWRTSAIFMVPKNSSYNGYQFVNILTYKDSLRNITIARNDSTLGSITAAFPPQRVYQIPQHPELEGLTIKVVPGSYLLSGNTPFQCYSYGRTEMANGTLYGYAAPCGQTYGSHALPNPPKADITPSCGQWNVRVHENGSGGGIADVMLLDDPGGYIVKPPEISNNCAIIGTGIQPQNLMSLPFMVGDTSISFMVQVLDPFRNAYAAIYAVDLSGNDTVIQLSYTPPVLTLSKNKVTLPDTMVQATDCATSIVRVVSTGNGSKLLVSDSLLNYQFDITTTPSLPAPLEAGDSVIVHICYTPQDTNLHTDSIKISEDCIDTVIVVQAKGLTPLIFAGDHDFGNVPVGDTVCANIAVRNIGSAPLILTNGYHFDSNPDFTFGGQTPDTINPGAETMLEFCFHPSHAGLDESHMHWGTNLAGLFIHDLKDTTVLQGFGVTAGVISPLSNPGITLSITPNPASGIAMISLTGTPSASVEIFDVLGRNVASFRINESYEWNMVSLPAGTYIVRAQADGEVVSKRIIKR